MIKAQNRKFLLLPGDGVGPEVVGETKKILEFLKPKIASIGTSACPPYHLAIVVGGLSAEMNLKTKNRRPNIFKHFTEI